MSALCLSVRPSVTASSLQGVVELGLFMAWSKAYEPRIWIMVKFFLEIDPGRGQDNFKSWSSIFHEYLWKFYKDRDSVCVCVCSSTISESSIYIFLIFFISSKSLKDSTTWIYKFKFVLLMSSRATKSVVGVYWFPLREWKFVIVLIL